MSGHEGLTLQGITVYSLLCSMNFFSYTVKKKCITTLWITTLSAIFVYWCGHAYTKWNIM